MDVDSDILYVGFHVGLGLHGPDPGLQANQSAGSTGFCEAAPPRPSAARPAVGAAAAVALLALAAAGEADDAAAMAATRRRTDAMAARGGSLSQRAAAGRRHSGQDEYSLHGIGENSQTVAGRNRQHRGAILGQTKP